MAFPQGINFRSTTAYGGGGDSSPDYVENETTTNLVNVDTYPTSTPQGNDVGWEIGATSCVTRDRENGLTNIARLRGFHENGAQADNIYRIDLPSAGAYVIRIASGDQNYATTTRVDVYDTTTSLATLVNGTTSTGNRFFDATNVERTNDNWEANNASSTQTFSTTICRFQAPASSTMVLAHIDMAALGPTITGQPDDVSTYPGLTAQFSVTATGSGSLTYQWQRATGGDAYSNVSGGSGGTTATYTTPTLGFDENNYTYRCAVTDTGGTTNSRGARLSLTPNSSIAWIRQ